LFNKIKKIFQLLIFRGGWVGGGGKTGFMYCVPQ
jgi:hypothetical protein